MSRSVGAVDAVRSLFPEEAALILGIVTQLGDVWFLLAAVVLAYWLRPSDRGRTATILGIALGTIALLQGLKPLFGLSRPGTPLASADAFPVILHGLVEATATAGGHGFPSGHATLSTAVLFGLAGAVRIGSPRRRAATATALVAVVSLSRIALGVHFLVDVVAGVLVGLAVLAGTALAVRASPADRPTTALGLAVGVGVAAVLSTAPSLASGAFLSSPPHDPMLALGAALGALAGWQGYLALDRRGADRSGSASVNSSARALLAGTTSLTLLGVALAGAIAGDVTVAMTGAGGLCFAAFVVLPALVPRFDAAVEGSVPQWLREDAAGASS